MITPLQDSTIVYHLNSISTSIDKSSSSTKYWMSQIADKINHVSSELNVTLDVEPINSTLLELSQRVDSIGTALSTPSTVWGMSEGLARILIPSLVSLLVFFAGIAINSISSRNRVVSFKQTILFWCRQLLPQIKRQASEVQEFAQSLSAMEEIQGVQLIKVQLPLSQLSAISIEKFLHAFRFSTKERIDGLSAEQKESGAAEKGLDYNSHGLFCQFSYLDELHKRTFMEYDQYRECVKQYCDQWNETFSQVKKLIDVLISRHNDPQSQLLRNIIVTCIANVHEGINITEYNNYFVIPINTWAASNMNHQSYGETACSIRTGALRLSQIIYMFQTLTREYSQRFNQLAEGYSSTYESIQNAVNYFDGAKTKVIVKSF